jgi:hypothetical protein
VTRAERERRRGELEQDARRVVALLSGDYPAYVQVQRERGLGAEVWPLEAYLCMVWDFNGHLFAPELREIVKELFWWEGQRQHEERRRRDEEWRAAHGSHEAERPLVAKDHGP